VSELLRKALPALMVGVVILTFIAYWFQPRSPSILEVPQDQSQQNCTQYRDAESAPPQDSGTSINEVYRWSCEPLEKTGYEENREKKKAQTSTDADLLAQERVAYWTGWLGIFASFGFVGLIWTLFETRKMMQADARAYVELLHIEFEVHPTYGGELRFWLSNTGRTPAKRITFTGNIVVDGWCNPINNLVGASLDVLPGNAIRIAEGGDHDFLWRITDILTHINDAGTFGRRTGTIATEGPDTIVPTITLSGELEWFDIYGTRDTLRILEFAELHTEGRPVWLGNRDRPGKKDPT